MAFLDVVAVDTQLVTESDPLFIFDFSLLVSDDIPATEFSTLGLITVHLIDVNDTESMVEDLTIDTSQVLDVDVSDDETVVEDMLVETGKFINVSDNVSQIEDISFALVLVHLVSVFDTSAGEGILVEPYTAASFVRDPVVSGHPARLYGKILDEQAYINKSEWFGVWQYDAVKLEFTGFVDGKAQVRGSNNQDKPAYTDSGFQIGSDRATNGLLSFTQVDLPVWMKVEKTTAGTDSINCWFNGIISG